MDNQTMKALYYLRKNQIVLSFRLNSEKCGISASQAYAWSHDCYPFFHVDDEDDEAELYLDFFKVKKDFVTEVIEYLDAEWLKNKFHTFYELEDKFGRNRVELIHILRYLEYNLCFFLYVYFLLLFLYFYYFIFYHLISNV